MKTIKIIVLMLIIITAGFMTWFYMNKKPIEITHERAVLVFNNYVCNGEKILQAGIKYEY